MSVITQFALSVDKQKLFLDENSEFSNEFDDLVSDNINNLIQVTMTSQGDLVLETTEPVPEQEIADLEEDLDNFLAHMKINLPIMFVA
jgi:hypothetical protein